MSFLAITNLVNFFSCTLFGAFVLINNPRNAINRNVFYINACLVLYSIGYFFWQLSTNESDAMFWFKILCIGIILINVTLLHYTFALIGKYKQKRKELVIYYIINGIFIILNIGSLLYADLEPRFGLGFWPIPTVLFHLYFAFWCWEGLYVIILLVKGLSYTKGKIKEQIKYTIAAACIAFIGGSANWLVWYSIPFPPYPNILVSAGMALMAYATIRHQLMDIRSVFHLTFIWSIMSSLIIIPNIVLIVIVYPYLMRAGVNMLVPFAVFWFLANYAYLKKVQPLIDQLFNRRKYDLNRIESTFIENISTLKSLDDLISQFTELIRKTLALKRVRMVVCYSEVSMSTKKNIIFDILQPAVREWFVHTNNLVERSMVEINKDHDDILSDIIELFDRFEATYMVPFIHQGDILSLLILSEKLNLRSLTIYEVRFINRIKSTFSIALSNSIMFSNLTLLMENLENKVEERTSELREANEKLKEIDKMKTNFFANISHEIRTPLTLILTPVESALQGEYKQGVDDKFLKNIQRNAIRLLRLVNNLLDFTKIEEGKMKLKIQKVDFVKIMKNYLDTIHAAAESKGISLNFTSSIESLNLYLDLEKADKIGMNLFSNAIKFTERGGHIEIGIHEDNGKCYINVEDTGVGIPNDKINSIFDRFSQVDASSTRKYEGTGIGLALVKELIEMLGGTISVSSKYIEEYPGNHGTRFEVSLLKGKKHFENRNDVEFITSSELDESVSGQPRFFGMREMIDLQDPGKIQQPSTLSHMDKVIWQEERHSVLIVEDNPDMCNFLGSLLEDCYTLNFATDGKEGFDKAGELKPDLIIADVMMPVMDGYSMTKKIKEDESLKRIPVLMLTAKADIAHKIEGLEYGADDYLTKPFNSKELLVRIKTLLKTREYEKIIETRNEEIENELQTARVLQQKLLPEVIPEISGYKSDVVYIPMEQVGGDFYDFKANDDIIELFIADVSGHGLHGAFISMITKMAFESIRDRKSTRAVLYILNDIICRSTVPPHFVTACYCIINRALNTMTYSNAGHLPPLVYRQMNEEFLELTAHGPPLGLSKKMELEEIEIQLNKSDRLFLFTDGITECRDPERKFFGDDRFMNFIRANSKLSPNKFTEKLLSDLRSFSCREKFDDDLCLLVFDVL